MLIYPTKTEQRSIGDYAQFMSEKEEAALKDAAAKFAGKKVVHINATAKGGGVAEILKTLVPLQQSMGVDSRWYHLKPDLKLFEITKKLHNALQGEGALTKEEKEYYLGYNKSLSTELQSLNPDVLVIHDPQPLAAIKYLNNISAVARIHIDSTNPTPAARDFVLPFIDMYRKVVFSMEEFVPKDIDKDRVVISPPAIDPLSPKNRDISEDLVRTIFINAGINPGRPVITQVSRFDKWKDPLGVIKAYYIVKNEIPDVQLVLAGVMEAQDDPEAAAIFKEVEKQSEGDPDIFLISRPEQLGDVSMDIYINALQRYSDVILQKSIREGFGLTVTEAMWKERAVIGGNVGGIRLQIKDGKSGFLVNSVEEAAQRILELLGDIKLAQKIGKNARESVRKNFLITRFLRDEFDIMDSII